MQDASSVVSRVHFGCVSLCQQLMLLALRAEHLEGKWKWSDIEVKCQEVQICTPVMHQCHWWVSDDTSAWRLWLETSALVLQGLKSCRD